MIVITGAYGFIGSCLVRKLNDEGYNDLVLVDDFSKVSKEKNLSAKKFTAKIERENLVEWLGLNHRLVQFIFHLGARTDTTEFDYAIFEKLNVEYSKAVWNACVEFGLPLVYASSAATYGGGEFGYADDHSLIEKLKPLNPYGESKNEFDKWAVEEAAGGSGSRQSKAGAPYFWAGLKFFNVYGPNEYHKDRMASVIFHAFNQVSATGKMKLFRSHNPEFKDGEQLRDFVYVKDVVNVCYWLMHHRKNSGIYNLGSGTARTFLDLTKNVFKSLNKMEDIEFVDTPADIRDKYQYFTEAKMEKLQQIGYTHPFYSLEEGVKDYVVNYLAVKKYL
ncbi:ADP-glyceromanno-heptose 6-epimerase [soil metagenome]